MMSNAFFFSATPVNKRRSLSRDFFQVKHLLFFLCFWLATYSSFSIQIGIAQTANDSETTPQTVDAVRNVKPVLNGIDVLVENNFRSLKGRNIGLISNHTGLSIDGKQTAALLAKSDQVNLITIFSPEHGYSGTLDQSLIKGGVDKSTGIRIASLYGKTRSPKDEDLKGIDTLVFDIQDIGTRYYTYISTMGLAMRKCAEKKIRFVILDRPNPINGELVQGPVLKAGTESFVGCHTIPIRHGMTVGEIAKMLQKEWKLDLDLKIVKMKSWKRNTYFDQTGQRWINPSPNMRNLNQATLYPGIGILETTNLSVGRGTDSPFEVFGAPWIDAIPFAADLNQLDLDGVRFIPIQFRPTSSKFRGEVCNGIQIIITDRSKFHPVKTGLLIARTLYRHYPKDWNTKSLNRLIGNQQVTNSIKQGESWKAIENRYMKSLNQFKERRKAFLIY